MRRRPIEQVFLYKRHIMLTRRRRLRKPPAGPDDAPWRRISISETLLLLSAGTMKRGSPPVASAVSNRATARACPGRIKATVILAPRERERRLTSLARTRGASGPDGEPPRVLHC
jgi:hypothetical protein